MLSTSYECHELHEMMSALNRGGINRSSTADERSGVVTWSIGDRRRLDVAFPIASMIYIVKESIEENVPDARYQMSFSQLAEDTALSPLPKTAREIWC